MGEEDLEGKLADDEGGNSLPPRLMGEDPKVAPLFALLFIPTRERNLLFLLMLMATGGGRSCNTKKIV